MAGTTACSLPQIVGGGGPIKWSASRDRSMVREYKVTYRVQVIPGAGPNSASEAPGLPYVGAYWDIIGDLDAGAFCTPELTIEAVRSNEPGVFFDLTYTYSSGFADECFIDWEDNPALRVNKVSGGFNRYTKPAVYDRFGNAILSSSFERLTGPNVEFDESRPHVRVEQIVADLDLDGVAALMDGVNAFTMWGFAVRCVKLSGCTWEKLFTYGTFASLACDTYYKRILEFDINIDTFDRNVLDEGTKALHGQWDEAAGSWDILPIGTDPGTLLPIMPDYTNPNHFSRFADRNGNVTRVILNGFGKPYDPTGVTSGTDDDTQGYITIEKYPSVDFSILGLPLTL